MTKDVRLGVRLTADGKGFVGEIKIGQKALKQFGVGAQQAKRNDDRIGQSVLALHRHILRYVSNTSARRRSHGASWRHRPKC